MGSAKSLKLTIDAMGYCYAFFLNIVDTGFTSS